MINDKVVTVLAIGESGVGKSQNGCAFLQRDDAFEANSNPESCTCVTNAQSNTINGITRYYIDTQGWSSTDCMDEAYIQQMVEFLMNWKLGVNAFFIVLNGQCPRFDGGIQHMMMLINDFFQNPYFWNQTGIISQNVFLNILIEEYWKINFAKGL